MNLQEHLEAEIARFNNYPHYQEYLVRTYQYLIGRNKDTKEIKVETMKRDKDAKTSEE